MAMGWPTSMFQVVAKVDVLKFYMLNMVTSSICRLVCGFLFLSINTLMSHALSHPKATKQVPCYQWQYNSWNDPLHGGLVHRGWLFQ